MANPTTPRYDEAGRNPLKPIYWAIAGLVLIGAIAFFAMDRKVDRVAETQPTEVTQPVEVAPVDTQPASMGASQPSNETGNGDVSPTPDASRASGATGNPSDTPNTGLGTQRNQDGSGVQ